MKKSDHPLRAFLEEEDMTLAQLAKSSGYGVASLSRIIHGRQNPSQPAIRRICEASGGKLRPEHFFGAPYERQRDPAPG